MKGYYSRTELLARGWTMGAIAKFLGSDEDETRTNPHYRNAAPMRFWRQSRVRRAEKQPAYIAWRTKLDERRVGIAQTTTTTNRRSRFHEAYSSWRDALPKACEGMYELNHHAKEEMTTKKMRDEIYALKNDLIKLLYEKGYSTDCYLHHIILDAQECWACDGTGLHDDDEECWKCNGSGEHRPERKKKFLCFRFDVGGRSYSWHQPKSLVKYGYTLTVEGSTEMPDGVGQPKRVNLNGRQITEAKRLIAWVLGQASVKESMAA